MKLKLPILFKVGPPKYQHISISWSAKILFKNLRVNVGAKWEHPLTKVVVSRLCI